MNKLDPRQLNHKKVFLLDMDGTLYNEDRLFNGVIEFLQYLDTKKINYYFLTNNSSKSRNDYVRKLERLGVHTTKKHIIISTHIAANYINQRYQDAPIYVVGTASMRKELTTLGVNVVTEVKPGIVAVLVGNDTELTFAKLIDASYLLTNGAAFLATNIDRACPVSFGYVPDCGGICEMLTHATKRKPTYMGKPHAEIVNYVKSLTGSSGKDIVMVGDRLYTDMAMAVKRRMTSVCVLSGEADTEAIARFPYTIDYVFDNIAALHKAMKGNV